MDANSPEHERALAYVETLLREGTAWSVAAMAFPVSVQAYAGEQGWIEELGDNWYVTTKGKAALAAVRSAPDSE